MEIKSIKKLKLYGFNNLTKTLSFNMYDICYAKTPQHRHSYIEYIDEEYSAERLTNILTEVAHIIGANILNIAKQDYDPQGASVTMLISEEPVNQPGELVTREECGECELNEPMPDAVVCHLDKSHITVHTYPESHPDEGISTFRADIDVSTCGHISPLKALNFLINTFRPDIAVTDYRVRGFTRDVNGKKFFIDHKINSIQNYISSENRDLYQMIDVNVYQENIFHTKMLLKEFDLDNYLFGTAKKELMAGEKKKIKQRLKKEMAEIFYGRNIPKVSLKL
ncbi:adenosylmethionine decarboxylase [Sporomusa acidovorans]|uniref:S-adenosylmethionine decarboxylase proenzyme n=1 Tax=Sporomusa acidovorans (strain ATCC 49682 / DSM 3132 / Mol) TaxID=1123286 RepID=A0ABZ3IWE6_SPOA4|nr:adenosylmethionine decarboxylase [Sporomusa acidovorans]OZC23621.1 S-adenosylmethionine decarboxylase proenzyme precursor [Sporomusa acidovorans DSM 3132]SDE22747.1 S-adenosylmethionine decarboxylase [Sporomusa acidovorans]